MPANPKPPKPIRDAKHLKNIRQCCCVVCGRVTGIDPHHLLRTPEKAIGRRSGDDKTVPLCGPLWANHHKGNNSPHMWGDETKWFARNGLHGPSIARELWALKDEPEEMQRFAQRMAEVARRAGR